MNFRTISDFPQWVRDYNEWESHNSWPKEYQPIADAIYKKANEVADSIKLEKSYVNPSPYSQGEINNWLGCREDYYENYPVFACSKGFRPDDWDYVYDSDYASNFSRGGLRETKIGEWYFLVGFDFD
jgi:hypothetical protein